MAYYANISASSCPLSVAEKLAYEDTSDMVSLNDAENDTIIEGITRWVKVDIHNDRTENTDYGIFVIETDDRQYYTSSPSFEESFRHIWDVVAEDLGDETAVKVDIKVKKIPSKNYKGKEILSCKYLG